MQQLPQMASVSDLRHRHIEIFAKLTEGPVLIANRNRPAGVLISILDLSVGIVRWIRC